MPHILVVDDDRTVLEMLADLLHDAGYAVETCRDGKQVRKLTESTTFDLIILDILIPHANGFVLAEELRKSPLHEDTPIIIISGIYRSRNHRKKMIEKYGVHEYLDKPLDPRQILDLVREVCGEGTATHQQIKKSTSTTEDENPEPQASLVDPQAEEEKKEVEKAARSLFRTSAFVEQGSVDRNPIAAVLGTLWRNKRSGALLLKGGKRAKKLIYLHQGNAFAVKSNLVNECLGQVLVQERLISSTECEDSILEMKQSGRRQGEILVQMGSMTNKNLAFALELQLETKLFEPFNWEAGEFRFNATATLPKDAPKLQYVGPGVITEGIRRTYDETRLRKLMLPIIDVPLCTVADSADLSTIGLSAKELGAISEIELNHSTRELLDILPIDPPDSLRVIYTLIALGLVAPKE